MRRSGEGRVGMMRVWAATAVVALAAAPLCAQTQDSWAALHALSVGTRVVVSTASGALVEGGLESIGPDEIIVVTDDGDPRPIARAAIQTVRTARRDPVWNGVLAGAALGFGAGVGLGAAWYHGSGRYGAKPPGYQREFIGGMGVLGGVLGALIGWRIDAKRARSVLVYEAPSVP